MMIGDKDRRAGFGERGGDGAANGTRSVNHSGLRVQDAVQIDYPFRSW
jgi:hypothetical protein